MKFGFRKPRVIAPAVKLPHSHLDAQGHPQNCLNCEAALVGAYCHQCGQSAHTHRMSFKHFLLHDFVHGIWHLDKGFPATFKKAFIHPGKEIKSYLAGKRVGWFSILTMILLLYAVSSYVYVPNASDDSKYINKSSEYLLEFANHNLKWLLLGLAFVCSWSSALVFRRARLNLSEHTIANCFFLIGLLTINIVAELIPFNSDFWGNFILVAFLSYLIYSYYGLFRHHYTLLGWSWRIVTHGVLAVFLLFAVILSVMSIAMTVNGEKDLQLGIESYPSDSVHRTSNSH